MFQRNFFLLLTLILLASCGSKKSSNVNLELKGSLLFGGTVLAPYSTGGLMIWGKAQTGESFSKVLRNSETFNISLPNSVWRFYAMAWQSSSSLELQADAGLRCALSAPTELKGGDSNVSLNLNSSTCDTAPEFKGNLTSLASMNLNIHTCEDVTNFSNVDDRCRNDRNGAFYQSDKVPVMSVKVILEAYGDKIEMPVEEGLSRCFAFPSVDEAMMGTGAGNLVIPQGNPANPSQSPFRVTLLYDLETVDCSAPLTRMIKTSLNSGIAQVPANMAVVTSGSSLHLAEAISDTRLCQGREGLTPFAGGDGTNHFPYLMCSEKQLYTILDSPSYLSYSYRLGRSLNLLHYVKGVATTPQGYEPLNYSAWEIGQTWEPFGLADAFTGSFDGNNHKITGIFYRAESDVNLGFIGMWSPVTALDFIRDLTLEKVEISGDSSVGGLVGKKLGASLSTIENIVIRDSIIETRNKNIAMVGGLLGEGFSVILKKIKVLNTKVFYEGNNAGGVFGHLMNTSLVSEIYSSAHVLPRYRSPMTMPTNVGGIGGFIDSTILSVNGLSKLAFEGVIESIAFNVGGIFGVINQSNQPLENFYVNAALFGATTDSHSIGGIVGRIIINMTLQNGYFSGSINDRCTAGCNRGLVYGSNNLGAATITGSNLVVYNQNQPTAMGEGDTGITFTAVPNLTGAGSLYDTGFSNTILGPEFIYQTNALPRFLFDQHPCLETVSSSQIGSMPLSAQLVNGFGSINNPLRVCHKEQFEEISTLPNGTHAEIVSGINISGTYTPPIIPTGVHVKGRRGFIFGYNKVGAMNTTADVFSPIAQNNGFLKDLSFANIKSSVTTASAVGVNTGIVKNNAGLIENVHLLTGELSNLVGTGQVRTTGFVGRNESTGVIKKSSNSLYMMGDRNVVGMVAENYGLISEMNIAPQIVTGNPSQTVLGLFHDNYGQINLIRLSGVFEGMDTHGDVHLLGKSNFAPGIISDIEIASDMRWGIPMASNYSIGVFQNTGTVRRVVMKGTLYDTDNMTTAITPGYGKAIINNTGILEGFYTFSPSGREIYSGDTTSSHTCTGNTLSLYNTDYFVPAPFNLGAVFFNTGLGATKFIWLVVDVQGKRNSSLFTGMIVNNTTQLSVTLEKSCVELGYDEPNARFSLIQDNGSNMFNAKGNFLTGPYNGVLTYSELDSFALANPVWFNSHIDPTFNPLDLETMINYFLSEILGQNPPPIPPWESEEFELLELITLKN